MHPSAAVMATHPAAPAGCASPDAVRARTATASLCSAATYTCRLSGLTRSAHGTPGHARRCSRQRLPPPRRHPPPRVGAGCRQVPCRRRPPCRGSVAWRCRRAGRPEPRPPESGRSDLARGRSRVAPAAQAAARTGQLTEASGAGIRARTTSASCAAPATYAFRPSGLSATPSGHTSERARAQPPTPKLLMQPRRPGAVAARPWPDCGQRS